MQQDSVYHVEYGRSESKLVRRQNCLNIFKISMLKRINKSKFSWDGAILENKAEHIYLGQVSYPFIFWYSYVWDLSMG